MNPFYAALLLALAVGPASAYTIDDHLNGVSRYTFTAVAVEGGVTVQFNGIFAPPFSGPTVLINDYLREGENEITFTFAPFCTATRIAQGGCFAQLIWSLQLDDNTGHHSVLASGGFACEARGIGGPPCPFTGELLTFSVPGPVAGAGLPGLLLAGLLTWWRRRVA